MSKGERAFRPCRSYRFCSIVSVHVQFRKLNLGNSRISRDQRSRNRKCSLSRDLKGYFAQLFHTGLVSDQFSRLQICSAVRILIHVRKFKNTQNRINFCLTICLEPDSQFCVFLDRECNYKYKNLGFKNLKNILFKQV